MMIKLHSSTISAISGDSMTHSGSVVFWVILERCTSSASLRLLAKTHMTSILKQKCEHSHASDPVTDIHVLVVAGDPTSQALCLLEFVVGNEVFDLGEHSAALLCGLGRSVLRVCGR